MYGQQVLHVDRERCVRVDRLIGRHAYCRRCFCFVLFFFFLMIRRPQRSTRVRSSAASDVYKETVAGVLPNDYLASFEEGGMLFLQNYKGCFHSFWRYGIMVWHMLRSCITPFKHFMQLCNMGSKPTVSLLWLPLNTSPSSSHSSHACPTVHCQQPKWRFFLPHSSNSTPFWCDGFCQAPPLQCPRWLFPSTLEFASIGFYWISFSNHHSR